MENLNTSTLVLSHFFLDKVRGFEKDESGIFQAPNSYKIMVFNQFEELLRKGLKYTKIKNMLNNFENKDIYGPFDMFPEEELRELLAKKDIYHKETDELIAFGVFYFHPILQEKPKPPITYIDYETMEMTTEEVEDVYLEIKDSFRMKDLVDYFFKETAIAGTSLDNPIKRKASSTQFQDIINNYGLDKTIYLIDASVMHSLEENTPLPPYPIAMLDRIDLAEELLNNRKEILREGGLDSVRPRKNTYD